MNARRIFGMASLIVLTIVSAAAAAGPGTNKSRGIYNRGGWESVGGAARQRYVQRAPATYYAPIVRPTEAPQVAQAPVEGRRFSYAPSSQAVTSPCPPTAVDSGRRYSYAPSTPAIAPQTSAPRMYYSQPSYRSGRGGSGYRGLWELPKADPRKYNSR
jgi:hypothetical protein